MPSAWIVICIVWWAKRETILVTMQIDSNVLLLMSQEVQAT